MPLEIFPFLLVLLHLLAATEAIALPAPSSVPSPSLEEEINTRTFDTSQVCGQWELEDHGNGITPICSRGGWRDDGVLKQYRVHIVTSRDGVTCSAWGTRSEFTYYTADGAAGGVEKVVDVWPVCKDVLQHGRYETAVVDSHDETHGHQENGACQFFAVNPLAGGKEAETECWQWGWSDNSWHTYRFVRVRTVDDYSCKKWKYVVSYVPGDENDGSLDSGGVIMVVTPYCDDVKLLQSPTYR